MKLEISLTHLIHCLCISDNSAKELTFDEIIAFTKYVKTNFGVTNLLDVNYLSIQASIKKIKYFEILSDKVILLNKDYAIKILNYMNSEYNEETVEQIDMMAESFFDFKESVSSYASIIGKNNLRK